MCTEDYKINKGIEEILMNDKVYCDDLRDLSELKAEYEKLDISKSERFIIDDYIECLKTVNERAKSILYFHQG